VDSYSYSALSQRTSQALCNRRPRSGSFLVTTSRAPHWGSDLVANIYPARSCRVAAPWCTACCPAARPADITSPPCAPSCGQGSQTFMRCCEPRSEHETIPCRGMPTAPPQRGGKRLEPLIASYPGNHLGGERQMVPGRPGIQLSCAAASLTTMKEMTSHCGYDQESREHLKVRK
jgi:hypothetical protein